MDVHLIPCNKVSYPGGTFEAKNPTKGIIPPLARHLIAAGVDPATEITVYREGNIVFNPVPLYRWADLAVSESKTQCARLVRYQPFPESMKKDQ